MNSESLIEILTYSGIGLGLILAILLVTIKRSNKSSNSILMLLLFLASFMLAAKVFSNYNETENIRWVAFSDITIFLFGPLAFLYVKRITDKTFRSYKLPFLHFIPALAYLLFSIVMLRLSNEQYFALNERGGFRIVFFYIEILGLLFNFNYWILNRNQIQKYLQTEKKELSFTQPIGRFLIVMLYTILTLLTLWLISSISSSFFRTNIPLFNYGTVWVAIPIVIYIIGGYALFQPHIFKIPLEIISKEQPKQRLEEREIEGLKHKLNGLIIKEKIHLNPTLTLTQLSSLLDTSPNDLSWLLNNVFKSSFYDYINQLRVEEFLKKINNKEHKKQTLLALSMDVGFNSKSTFNKAFKNIVKDTPSNYIKSLNA